MSLRSFLRLAPPSAPPDHSTISRTRRLLSVETHEAVFTWVLQQLADAGLVRGRTVGIDATTLEANAALRSIVRRETGEDYTTFLTRLAEASGIATPTRAELARFDRSRKKKTSNAEWTHPHDPDARVTKMKDGRTHLAHKAEHTVDLETGAVVGVTVQGADTGDTASMVETLIAAAEQVDAVLPDGPGIEEVVGDEGYHSNETMADLKALVCAATSRSRTGDAGAGSSSRRLATPCMPTGAGSAGSGAVGSCGVAESCWSGRSRTCARRAGCDGSIFEDILTSGNGCSCTSPAATSGCCCVR